jgi:hypothetical protein
MFTKEETLLLLQRLGETEVARFENFVVRSERSIGYSRNPDVAKLQGKLFLLLASTTKKEAHPND